jgi:lipid-A-disaccharide synthase
MVAGEASGDLLASLLLDGLRRRWPGTTAAGIGGPRMVAGGFDAWWPADKLSVFGYVDALMHLRELLGIRRALRERLLADRPDVFIGVDAPDFNFGLETSLREQGVRTVHFVCPSIWAWRAERVTRIARAADHVLCLFPFEPALLQAHGIAASYVGHPLADVIPLEPDRAAARGRLGLAEGATVVALLPGSRRSEVKVLVPLLARSAARLHAQRPDLEFILPVVPGLGELVAPLLAANAPGVPVRCLDGRSHDALAACDLTLVASGTATLEAALFKRPMVIVYRMNPLSWWRMKRMRYQPWAGLPNILAREFLVPELIQDEATPEAVSREALAWLDQPARMDALRERFLDMHHLLRRDTAQAATDAIAQVLGR